MLSGFKGGLRNLRVKNSRIARTCTQNKYKVSSLTTQIQMGLERKYLQKVMWGKIVLMYCEHVGFFFLKKKGNLHLSETST